MFGRQLIEFAEAQVAGRGAIQGHAHRGDDQEGRHRADHADDLVHVQAHDGDHDQRHQYAAGDGRNTELLLQQGTATGQHHHGHGEHEEGDHQVHQGPQVLAAQGLHHVLVRRRSQAAAHAGQGHAEEGEQRRADHRTRQAPGAEVDEHQQQFTTGGEPRADNHTDEGAGDLQTFFHDD